MTVNYSIPENQKGEFEIFNMLGSQVVKYPLQSGEMNSLFVSDSDLTKGIHMYRFTLNGKVVEQGKIVVIK